MGPLAPLLAGVGSMFATAAPVAAEGAAAVAPVAAGSTAAAPLVIGGATAAGTGVAGAGAAGAGTTMQAIGAGSQAIGGLQNPGQSGFKQATEAMGVLGQLAGLGASILQKPAPKFSPMGQLQLSTGQAPDLMAQLGQMQSGFRGN